MSTTTAIPRLDAGPVRIAHRLASFSVCLPAEPAGSVVVLCDPIVSAALVRRFPGATLLEPGGPMPEPGAVGLLIVEEDLAGPVDQAILREAVAEGGVIASIRSSGQWAYDPGQRRQETIWRSGWPFPHRSDLRSGLRRNVGVLTASLRRTPYLRVETVGEGHWASLADRVAEDLGSQLGHTYRLAGVVAANTTVLRMVSDVDEVAVRLSWTNRANAPDLGERVLDEVPGLRGLLPRALARGVTAGTIWVATRWMSPCSFAVCHRSGGFDRVAERTVAVLSASTTGRIGPGWARVWVGRAGPMATSDQDALVQTLAPLENGFPTSWSHGGSWPDNVLFDGDRGYVVDWENAVSDAPRGIDRVLVALQLRQRSGRVPFADACGDVLNDRALGPVAGRLWFDWDIRTRVALLAAAYLLGEASGSIHAVGGPSGEDQVGILRRLARTAENSHSETEDVAAQAQSKSPMTNGAAWLGLGAAVVKGSQTIVLLVLAALLAPSSIGVLSIGALVLNVLTLFTDMGSSTALVYWRGNAERAARTALTLAVASSTLLTLGGFVLAPILAEALRTGEEGVRVIRGLVFCLPLCAIAGVSKELLRRNLSFKLRVLPDIIGALIGATVSVLLAVTGHGVMSLVIGQIVQYAVVMVLCWMVRHPVLPGWNRSDAGGLLAYGSGLAGANIVELLVLNTDYVIVARVLGAPALGVYSMAFRLAYMPYLLIAVVLGGAAFAHLCRITGSEVGSGVIDTMADALTMVVPLYLGMALLAPYLALLGPQWTSAVPALRWLAGFGLVLSLLNGCTVGLNAISRTRDGLVIMVAHLVALVVLLLVLAPLGVTMVGVGQFAAVVLSLTVGWVLLQRRVPGVDVVRLVRRARPVVAAALAMTVTWALANLLSEPSSRSPIGLLTVGPLMLIVYVIVLVALDRRHVLRMPVIGGMLK